jgi:NADPH:quinone reductase-like Zn-dependent oxidoreductase
LLRANLVPITTCSPHNFDLVQSYGAAAAFDYKQPDCSEQIRAYTRNNLAYALDCITTVESMNVCSGAIGRAGGRYTSLDPFAGHAATRKVIKNDW